MARIVRTMADCLFIHAAPYFEFELAWIMLGSCFSATSLGTGSAPIADGGALRFPLGRIQRIDRQWRDRQFGGRGAGVALCDESGRIERTAAHERQIPCDGVRLLRH